MKYLIACIFLLINQGFALKILISGDYDDTRSVYFALISDYYGRSRTNHTYHCLSKNVPTKELVPINETNRNYYLGLPKIAEEYVEDLAWDAEKMEEENFLNIEKEQIRLLFSNPDYIEWLRE